MWIFCLPPPFMTSPTLPPWPWLLPHMSLSILACTLQSLVLTHPTYFIVTLCRPFQPILLHVSLKFGDTGVPKYFNTILCINSMTVSLSVDLPVLILCWFLFFTHLDSWVYNLGCPPLCMLVRSETKTKMLSMLTV